MPNALIYVESQVDDESLVVRWAADLVEAASASADVDQPQRRLRVAVVAELMSCLEIGISLLGRAAPRTVEGGERVPSPLTLLPYAPRDVERRGARLMAYECLVDLANTGAVEGIREYDNVQLRSAAQTLQAALDGGDWDTIILLGRPGQIPDPIGRWMEQRPNVTLVRVLSNEEVAGRMEQLLQRVQPQIEDELNWVRRNAVYRAIQLEQMLLQLPQEP